MLCRQTETEELRGMSTLAVAAVGDAVFDLLVRSKLCLGGAETAGDLHRSRVEMVNATAQAGYARKLLPLLTPEEGAYYKRGRNQKPNNVPKSSNLSEYCAATALEALFGYLYLAGREVRLMELFDELFPAVKE